MSADRDVQAALDRMDAAYGGDLSEYVEDWEEIMRPILEETWGLGYATGLADRPGPGGIG